MQFAVPQFTDVEDKLIGPLTLKQFLVLLFFGGLILMFYSLLKLSIFFFFFAIPVGLLGIALTFGKYNGQPMLGYFPIFLSYLLRPQVRVFKREETMNVSFKVEKKEETPVVVKADPTTNSRLKKLAYLLDQKSAEIREQTTNKNG